MVSIDATLPNQDVATHRAHTAASVTVVFNKLTA